MSSRSRTPRRRTGKRELHVVATSVPRPQPDIPRLVRLLVDFARQHQLHETEPEDKEAADGQD